MPGSPRPCAARVLARCPRAGEEPSEGSLIIGRPWWAASLGQEVAAEEARSLGGPAVQAASRMPLEKDSRDPLLLGSSEGTHVTSQRLERWRQVEQVAVLDPRFLTL